MSGAAPSAAVVMAAPYVARPARRLWNILITAVSAPFSGTVQYTWRCDFLTHFDERYIINQLYRNACNARSELTNTLAGRDAATPCGCYRRGGVKISRGDAGAIYALLNELGINYSKTCHPPAYTMDDLSFPEQELGARFCKNLFLCNRQQTEYFLLLMGGDKRFRTADVSRRLNRARLSFGGEAELERLLGVTPGAVSPLGLIYDKQRELTLVVDRDLLSEERICLHPCVNTESVAVMARDLFEVYIPHCGHVPEIIEV